MPLLAFLALVVAPLAAHRLANRSRLRRGLQARPFLGLEVPLPLVWFLVVDVSLWSVLQPEAALGAGCVLLAGWLVRTALGRVRAAEESPEGLS